LNAAGYETGVFERDWGFSSFIAEAKGCETLKWKTKGKEAGEKKTAFQGC